MVKRVALTTDAQSIYESSEVSTKSLRKRRLTAISVQQSIQLEYHRLTITNIKQQLESDQNQQTRNLTWAKNSFKHCQVQGVREQVPNQKERQRPERL
jgi:ABC-type nitrate/sulfonate/bicarbonate transport system ATPase subunit